MKRSFSQLLATLFFLQLISPVAYAEKLNLRAPDIEPPTILFDAGDAEISDGIKTFTATVTDNRGVAAVTLYFKHANDIGFTPKAMKRTGSSTYSTQLSVDSVITDKLEFYIRADDISGNTVFEGQKFSPFVYSVIPVSQSEGYVSNVSGPSGKEDAEQDEGMSMMTKILIGIGTIALIGAAGGSGGGSSGSGGGDSTGNVTITTPLPD